ncbi:MAG: hypothetical protein GXY19_20805, partial [Phycisphaerae bacterium]|nr:hypothetical protein [Phycisphaerae bacterium]
MTRASPTCILRVSRGGPGHEKWASEKEEGVLGTGWTMKTYEQINQRIESGKAVVLTADEIMDYVD